MKRLFCGTLALCVVLSIVASLLGCPGLPGHVPGAMAASTTTWYEQLSVSSSVNSVRAGHWIYQTFTPSTAHYFNTVSLNIYKVGVPSYTVTMALYNVDGDHAPLAGTPLCSTTFAAALLTTTATWRTYEFSSGYQVSAGTEYALVLSANGGNTTSYVAVRVDTAAGYSGGLEGHSTDAGTTWTQFSPAQDIAFKEGFTTWSEVYVTPTGSDTTGSGSSASPWKTVQYAVANPVVLDGCIVHVAAGTYVEQVDISKNVTVIGAGATSTIVQSPDVLQAKFTSNTFGSVKTEKPIVYVHDVGSVVIDGLGIDGAGKGNGNSRMEGIALYNAGGTIRNCEIKDVRETPLSGAQHGVGIYALSDNVTARTLSVSNNSISGYQKNGMAFLGQNLTVSVTGNTVSGAGPTGLTAQNGIELALGAGGTVGPNNTISGNYWTGTYGGSNDPVSDANADGATGVCLYASGNVTIQTNTLTANQFGLWSVAATTVDIQGNDITGTADQGSAFVTGIAVWDADRWTAGFGMTPASTTASITNSNRVSSNHYGVVVLDYTVGDGYQPVVAAHGNNISGNSAYGVWANVTVNAEENWWGSADGPAPTGAGNAVSGGVDCDPQFGTPATVYVDGTYTGNSAGGHLFGYDAFTTVQEGINAVAAGGTVNVAAGTYTGQVNISKNVSVIGAGMDQTIITGGNPAVLLAASGTEASPVLLKDLEVLGVNGIRTAVTPIAYLTLDHVAVVASTPDTGEGFRVQTDHSLTHLSVVNSVFEGFRYGLYAMKTVGSGDSGTKLQYVAMTDTVFRDNYEKGIYVETLSDATFTNIEVMDNGIIPGAVELSEKMGAGIDINLKDGTYSNLTFNNIKVSGNGLETPYGAGVMIKARGTGLDSAYSSYPATLTNVTIEGGAITRNERGIRFGEPGKENTGPTNVTIHNARISGNVQTYDGSDGSTYGGLVNETTATVDATGNWWGDNSGPGGVGPGTGDAVTGYVSYDPWTMQDRFYEQYTVSNSANSVRSGHWVYQTFTPSTAHTLNTVSLYLAKVGFPSYTVTIGVYGVDGDHKPLTGAPLCSTTFAASSLSATATWYPYSFSTGCQVSAGTEYALVLSADGGNTSSYAAIRVDTAGGYSGGLQGKSTDQGTTWTVFDPAQDMAFKEGQFTGPFGWYEQHTVGNTTNSVRAGHWVYQTFTPSATHYLTTVSLYLSKVGAPSYTVTIGLYEVDGNHRPIMGTPLCSTTFAASSLTTSAAWRTYTFPTGCQVFEGTEYALVLSGSGGTTSAYVAVAVDTAGGYGGGLEGRSIDSGTTWTVFVPAQDIAFKEGQF